METPKTLWEHVVDAGVTIEGWAEGLLGDDGPDPIACRNLALEVLYNYAMDVDCQICSKLDFSRPCQDCDNTATKTTECGDDLCDGCYVTHLQCCDAPECNGFG